MKSYAIAMLLATILAFGCRQTANVENQTTGIDLTLMDTTVNPADDFFRYVNGKWLDETEIPGDRRRWGSFDELRQKTTENTLKALKEAIDEKAFKPGTDQEKAILFFKAAMDTINIDKAGIEPVRDELAAIDAIETIDDLQEYLIASAPWQHGAFFGFGVMADFNDSDINAGYVTPGALGLPERAFYINDDSASQKIQDAYRRHIQRMFGFLGYDEAQGRQAAKNIYDIEYRLAEARLTKEEARNTTLLNNPRSIAQLAEMTPTFDWNQYFHRIGAGDLDTVIVMQPVYMAALDHVLKEIPVDQLRQYVKWSQFNQWSGFLNSDIEKANFDFYYTELEGIPEMKPRDESVLGVLNGRLGEALGQVYVDRFFPPEAKEVALEMVNDLKLAFRKRIVAVDWMSDTTKDRALAKLDAFSVKIGYPDQWKDYSELEVRGPDEGGTYISNMISFWKWNWHDELKKLGAPVDKNEWYLPPQVVNAYYSPLFNEIVFPAAILQPPFFNHKADPAINFGGIGAVIGHEMSHGFDDRGSRFDHDGNLKNWWEPGDRERFYEKAQKLIEQFDAYEPFEGVHVNGTFTLGENIGDLGGVNIAYDGLKQHLEEHGDPGTIDGYTQDQRFFISWATIWRTKMRDEALKNQIKTDPHSPGQYRAVGPLSNLTAFYEAFDVDEGNAMWRPAEQRVHIW